MITFIIPAYQAETTLRRTIESVMWQTDNRWQMILVNDGSLDGTKQICEEFQKLSPQKITYIYQENGGLGKARNVGIPLVKTEYMCFLDSDDWLMPNFVERIVFHSGKNKPEIIMTLPVIWQEGSKTVRDWYDKPLFETLFVRDGQEVIPESIPEIYTLEVNACRKILRTDFVHKIGFHFPEGIKWEDVYPHFYLLSKCKSCMGISSVGFYYRVGSPEQITALRVKDRLDILPIFHQLLTYINEEQREELKFPAMRVFVRFSIWCIKMTEGELRVELVQRLSSFFKKVPGDFYIELRRGTKHNYSKADRRQYALFLLAIRYRVFRWIFYDYLYEDAAEKIVKKILKAKERVG